MRVHRLTQALNSLSLKADTAAYASLLRQCRDSKALTEGKQVHVHLIKNGYQGDTYIANLLIEMYGSCGCLDLARAVFDSLRHRNVYTWNLMFAGYAQNGHVQRAKCLFDSMPVRDSVSWSSMVVLYGQIGDVWKALEVFMMIPDPDVVAWTAMISALAKNGHLGRAREMFDNLEFPNTVTWNVMIQAYAQKGNLEEASNLMDRMPCPDVVSWTALVTANAYHGDLKTAKTMFDLMPQRNTVSWNAILQAYALHGHMEEAHAIFDDIPRRNVVSWTCMVAAYAKNGYLRDSRSMFDLMPEQDLASWNAILAAYAENGHLEDAKQMFVEAPERNVVSWTALIKAYIQSGNAQEALELISIMDVEGVKPDEVTYIIAVDACASLAALAQGRLLHNVIADDGFEGHFVVGTSLINMYGKCGKVGEARLLFDKMPLRNDAVWNAMMLAYAQNQHGKDALELFPWMQLEGTKPDSITFVTLLFGCSHAGLIEDGRSCLLSLSQDYSLVPSLDHYVCIIDLLGRAGQIEQARELMSSMPYEPDDWAWTAMLSASRRCEQGGGNSGAVAPSSAQFWLVNSNKAAAAAPLYVKLCAEKNKRLSEQCFRM